MLDGRLPDFLVIGAMRSGTTSLARYLGAHPELYVVPNKELRFFDRHFERGLDSYRRDFAGARDDQLAGEATQTYLYDPTALERMAAAVPRARLIAILRDPVDRAYSHYWQNRALGKETLSFADAVTAEPERLRTGDLDLRFRYSYLDRGRYIHQLQRVIECSPHAALHVLLFEDLRDEPAATFQAVCRFLGVDDTVQPPNLGDALNGYVTFRSRLLRRVSRRFPKTLKSAVGRLNVRPAAYEPIDATLRTALANDFADDNAALAKWLGRDLSGWSSLREPC